MADGTRGPGRLDCNMEDRNDPMVPAATDRVVRTEMEL